MGKEKAMTCRAKIGMPFKVVGHIGATSCCVSESLATPLFFGQKSSSLSSRWAAVADACVPLPCAVLGYKGILGFITFTPSTWLLSLMAVCVPPARSLLSQPAPPRGLFSVRSNAAAVFVLCSVSCIVMFGIECSGFLEWLSGRVDCCKPVVKFYPQCTLRAPPRPPCRRWLGSVQLTACRCDPQRCGRIFRGT